MKNQYFHLFGASFCWQLLTAQLVSYPPYLGPQISITQNAQQINPAAFSNTDQPQLQIQGAFIAQLPGFQLLSVALQLPRKKLYLSQQTTLQGISSYHILSNLTSIGLELNSQIKMGVGLGFQTIFQPAKYGTRLTSMVKFGLQYQLDAQQYFGLTFEINAPFELALFKWAYANQLSAELICFAHINWYQSIPPQFCFGFQQKMKSYQLLFMGALQPQLFSMALQKQMLQTCSWSVGIQWQQNIGLGLVWGFKFCRK
ncbi:MAG: hypothetical protein ACKOWW_03900 [Flavobacteriales bacterium]